MTVKTLYRVDTMLEKNTSHKLSLLKDNVRVSLQIYLRLEVSLRLTISLSVLFLSLLIFLFPNKFTLKSSFEPSWITFPNTSFFFRS